MSTTRAQRDARQTLARTVTAHRRPAGPTEMNEWVCKCGDRHWSPLHVADEILKEEQALATLLCDEALLAELVKRGRLKVEMILDEVPA